MIICYYMYLLNLSLVCLSNMVPMKCCYLIMLIFLLNSIVDKIRMYDMKYGPKGPPDKASKHSIAYVLNYEYRIGIQIYSTDKIVSCNTLGHTKFRLSNTITNKNAYQRSLKINIKRRKVSVFYNCCYLTKTEKYSLSMDLDHGHAYAIPWRGNIEYHDQLKMTKIFNTEILLTNLYCPTK